MGFSWIESLLIGIMTGLAEILPVSAQAHSRIIEKFMGKGSVPALMLLFMHLGVLAALYISCQVHILKMVRAKKMSRIPKRKRKRPLDTRSMMDYSLWMTMLLPVILSLLAMNFLEGLATNAIIMATFLFLNALLLYIPQFLPSSNKDCRSLSRVEGLLMGLGGAFFAIPGFSGTGLGLSVASVTGVDRKYGLNMILLMDMGILAGKTIYDILDIIAAGVTGFGFAAFAFCVMAAVAAFISAYLAIRMMRNLAEEKGYGFFAYYSWGMALFTLILTLMA
jgi:undecaprenyl-diphosphatase